MIKDKNNDMIRIIKIKGRAVALNGRGGWLKNGLVCAVLLLAAVLSGCVKDHTESGVPTPPSGGRAATFTVTVPGMKTPSTRALTSDKEQEIAEIDVVIFDNGSKALLEYHRVPNIAPSGSNWQFNVSDIDHTNNITAAIIANASNEVSQALATLAANNGGTYTGVHKTDFLEFLLATRQGKWNTSENNYWRIPMYGEVKVTGNIYEQGALDADLVRMLARVDVLNDKHPEPAFGPRPGDFMLTKVHVVHYNTCGAVAPKWHPVTGDTPYTNPADPTNRPGNAGKILWEKAGDELTYDVVEDGTEMDIYLFECQAQHKMVYDPENPVPDKQTRLIFEGEYYNSIGEPEHYYYPVDFRKDRDPGAPGGWEDAKEYIPVLRNYRYRFQITEVSGRGYDELGEAVVAMGVISNMKTSLLVVDESGIRNIVWNGEYFLGTEDREVTLGGGAGSTASVKVSTNYSDGWQIDTDKGVNGIEYVTGDNWLSATPATPGDPKSTLELTALSDNLSENERTAIVHLKAGRLTHTITVTQRSGFLFDVTTSHVNGDAIPIFGTTYTITVTGYAWPVITVRALQQGTSIEAGRTTVNAGSGTGTQNINVKQYSTWNSNRTLELQWSEDELLWNTLSSGIQTGLSHGTPTLSHNSILGRGERVTVMISGDYPNNFIQIRAISGDTQIAINYMNASTTSREMGLVIPSNDTGVEREVHFEYRLFVNGNYEASWRPISVITQPISNITLNSGCVVARDDASEYMLDWAEAMGIDAKYNFELFTENQPDFQTRATGCAGYSESGYPAGSWRLPTITELEEMYDMRTNIGGFNAGFLYRSATQGDSADYAWDIFFRDNKIEKRQDPKQIPLYVRCVRNQ